MEAISKFLDDQKSSYKTALFWEEWFSSEFHGNELIDNSTICLDVSWDQLTVRRKSPLGTFTWQMAMCLSETYDLRCSRNMISGAPHSYLHPDLRVGTEPPKAWPEFYKSHLIPHKVSRETSLLVPCLQMHYWWVSHSLSTSQCKQCLEVLKLLSLQCFKCLHGKACQEKSKAVWTAYTV